MEEEHTDAGRIRENYLASYLCLCVGVFLKNS